MKKFIEDQIYKISDWIRSSQTSERNESFFLYRFLVFDVTFGKTVSTLEILIELFKCLKNEHYDDRFIQLIKLCKDAIEIIQEIEAKGKKESFTSYNQSKLDIDIEKLNTIFSLILDRLCNMKDN